MYTFFYDFIEINKKYHILYFLFFLSRLHKKVYMVYTNTQKISHSPPVLTIQKILWQPTNIIKVIL